MDARARRLITSWIGHVHSTGGVRFASGQIGFLQQLTDNKAVLRAAWPPSSSPRSEGQRPAAYD